MFVLCFASFTSEANILDFVKKLTLIQEQERILQSKEHKELKNIAKKSLKFVVLIHTFNEKAKKDHLIYNSELQPRETPFSYDHGVTNGTIISKTGYVVATYAGVKNSSRIIISLDSELKQNSIDSKMIITGSDYEAKIIREYPEFNITILKILPKNATEQFPYVTFGNINELKKSGETILNKSAFSLGKAAGKNFVTINKPTNSENTFRVIASPIENVGYEIIDGISYLTLNNSVLGTCLFPENSGGCIIDKNGKMLGIPDYQTSNKLFYLSKFVAIPIDVVRKVCKITIPTLMDNSFEHKPFGTTFLDNQDGRVYVETVEEGSEADNAGIKQGDVILKMAEKDIANAKTMQNLIDRSIGDGSITFKILRDNKNVIDIDINR
jgi:S1-C subfamily serine protease